MANSDNDRDGRNAVTRGYVIATRATSIGFQMAIPPTIGWWADSSFNTAPWLLILGTVLGFGISMIEIVNLAKESERHKNGNQKK